MIDSDLSAGSSFAWDEHQDIGANNLVPVEIALRIVRAIRCGAGPCTDTAHTHTHVTCHTHCVLQLCACTSLSLK